MRMQKEVHLTGKDLTGMVQLRPQDVGKYAIVPGPKDRLDVLMKKIENPVRNFSFMEYTMYTGTYQGIKVTAINGGRFSTDTSITTEVMCNAQIPTIIRIGTCGAMDENIKVGDLVVVDKIIRGDGVTPYNIKAGSILAVSDNVITGEMGFMNPLYYMAETKLIEIALETVKRLEGK